MAGNTKNKKKLFLLLTSALLLYANVAFTQKQGRAQLDSLLTELPKITTDTGRINAWNTLARSYSVINPDSGLIYGNLSLEKSNQVKWLKGQVNALNRIALNYWRNGTYAKSLTFSFESISRNSELRDSTALASSYQTISSTYMYLGDNVKALKYLQDELVILEKRKNKVALPGAYNLMGMIQTKLEMHQEALKYYEKALSAAVEVNDKKVISYAYSNSGSIYTQLNQFSKALTYHFKALKIEEEMGDVYGMGTEYGSISDAYVGMYKEQKKKNGSSSSALIDSTIYYAKKGIEYCKKCDDLTDQMTITFSLAEVYKLKGDYKMALEIYAEGTKLKDSIFSSENLNKIREIEAKEQASLNEKELQLLQSQKKLERNYYLAGGIFLLLLSIGIFSRLQVIRKTKKKLEEKNRIIETQKQVVEEKNKEITQSIEYAKRIQSAILPPNRIVKQFLENSFILYKPKDIVAGDFYWMEQTPPNLPEGEETKPGGNMYKELAGTFSSLSGRSGGVSVLLAACDCTGHGVPGAMVSVVCHNALNRAVREFGLTQPAAILDKTAEIVIENFSKSEEEIKDGMDISLCAIQLPSPSERGKGVRLQWAGANNPLWIVRSNSSPSGRSAGEELIEIKADKQPIGMNENSKPFTNHSFTLNEGDSIYLFTDGFADQFGGDTGEKKLTKKRFKDLILSLQNKTMQEQGIALDNFITEYRKGLEQIDDILVIGVKI